MNRPARDRFTLMRVGLISLNHYVNEVFEAEDGKLLLRGSNGSGKSTAVELTVPLLFDGQLNQTNLSASDGQRSMKSHLELAARGGAGSAGYAWGQFARRDGDAERWVTLALGFKAASDSGVKSYFLIWDGAEPVRPEQLLVADHGANGRVPLARTQAKALDGVAYFDTAQDYQAKVNELLFGFSMERYEAMLTVVRQLRSSQLGRLADTSKLTEMLSLALPEVNADKLDNVSAKLEEIDGLRAALRSAEHASQAAQRFSEILGRYASGVVARQLTAAQAVVVERTARRQALEQAQGQLGAETALIDAVDEEIELIEEAQGHAEGQLRVLHGLDQFAAAKEIVGAGERLEQQRARLARLADQLEQAQSSVDEAQTTLTAACAKRDELADEGARRRRELTRLSEDCGVPVLSGAGELTLPSLQSLRLAHDARQDDIKQLEGAMLALAAAQAELERADEHVAEREDELGRARERKAVHEEMVADQRETLSSALRAWQDDLEQLVLDDEEIAQLHALASDVGEQGDPIAETLASAIARRRERLGAQKAELDRHADTLDAERADVERQRREVLDEHDEPPAPAPWRSASDDPALWQLCDFSDRLAEEQRDGLEAALTASGLLDASVRTDGQIRARDGQLLLDAGARRASGRSLADVLHAASQAPAALTGALQAVAVVDADADSGTHQDVTVGLDGSFACGPMAGRAAVFPAQFVGAAARQAARARRLQLLDRALVDLEHAQQQLVERQQGLAADRRRLDEELAERPSAVALQQALGALRAVADVHTRAVDAAQTARGVRQQADARRTERQLAVDAQATQKALPTSPSGLSALRVSLAELKDAISDGDLWAERLRGAEEMAMRAEREHSASQRRCAEVEEDAESERRRLYVLQGEYEALEERAGDPATVQELLGQVNATEAQLASIRRNLKSAQGRREGHVRQHAQLQTGIEHAELELQRADETVDVACDAMAELDARGLWADCGGVALGDDERWDADTVVGAAARQLEELQSRQHHNAEYVRRAFTDELRPALEAAQGYVPSLMHGDDGVVIVSARQAGERLSMRTVAERLEVDVERQRRLVAEDEERLLEDFLFNGLANELRSRLVDADAIRRDAAKAISGVRTSSGMQVTLAWRPQSELGGDVRRAIELMKHSDPRRLAAGERLELMDFFRARLTEAREAKDTATVAQHLREALDYRRWHEFTVSITKDGNTVQMTRRSHGVNSGGERSVALHLPMLAAFHALLSTAAAHAPRLVALDEAFAGVDGKGIGQLLGLMSRPLGGGGFDLDFVLNSEKHWFTSPQLARLGIYELVRPEGSPVASVHYIWDGQQTVMQPLEPAA